MVALVGKAASAHCTGGGEQAGAPPRGRPITLHLGKRIILRPILKRSVLAASSSPRMLPLYKWYMSLFANPNVRLPGGESSAPLPRALSAVLSRTPRRIRPRSCPAARPREH
eukprot:8762885-Pyramimonas_sp.AAC.1